MNNRTIASLYDSMSHITGEPFAYRGSYHTKESNDPLSHTVWHNVEDPTELPGKPESLSYRDFVRKEHHNNRGVWENPSPEDGFFLIPLCSYSDYSGTTVERSNFEVCLEEIEEYGGILGVNAWTVYGGHGTTALAIRGGWNIPEDCELFEYIEGLYSYAVISESHMSELEVELEIEAFADYIEYDLIRALEKKFSGPETDLDMDMADSEDMWKLYRYLMEASNTFPVFEDPNGPYIDIDRLAEACTLDDIYRLTGILPNGFQPSPGDFILSNTGRLGSRTLVTRVEGTGREAKEFDSEEYAMSYVLETMDKENVWPNVWRLSDHGNLISYNDPRQLDMDV